MADTEIAHVDSLVREENFVWHRVKLSTPLVLNVMIEEDGNRALSTSRKKELTLPAVPTPPLPAPGEEVVQRS